MKKSNLIPSFLPTAFGLLTSAGLLATACIADEPGLDAPRAAGAPSAGKSGQAGTSSGATAASPNGGGGATGGSASDVAGTAGSVSPNAGTESVDGGAGGAISGENAGGAAPAPDSCVFHTEPLAAADGAAGAGGAGPAPTITVQTSPFVGTYLADGAGRSLYVYGADLPGDCQAGNAPTSRCEADCLVSWPSFDAGERVLGAGLTDDGFGSIQRGDGTWQTTYFGWPLYYYKSDVELGQMTGQGKSKTWHVAETTPASIVIMKEGAVRYLADGRGRALYVSAADTVGSGSSDPLSACSGACLDSFERFRQKNPSVVQSLEEQDFSTFLAPGAELQLAYKGQPLYLARGDVKAGDTTGTATTGFTVALP